MKKYNLVLIALVGLFLISMASSLSIYPSETKNITLDFDCINYSIEGNTSYVNVTCNGSASIGLDNGYPIESFNITFYGSKDVQEVSVGSSGGSSSHSGGSLYIPKKKNNTITNTTITTNIPIIEDTNAPNYENEERPKENNKMWILSGIFLLIVIGLIIVAIKLNKNKEDKKNE